MKKSSSVVNAWTAAAVIGLVFSAYVSVVTFIRVRFAVAANEMLKPHIRQITLGRLFAQFIVSPPRSDSGLMFCWRCFRKIFSLVQRKISEMHLPIGVKFCTMISSRPNFIMPFQNFGGALPPKNLGGKTSTIWPNFRQLQSSTANISGTDEDIQKWSSTWSTAFPPALGKKVRWTLVHQFQISKGGIIPTQMDFFGRLFWPIRGAAPPNFHLH